MSDVATIKVELSDEQMDVLLRDIGDLIGKVDALEQRISDVNDANLYSVSQLEERIDALEHRIAKLENDQMLTMQTSPKKMPLQIAISYLEGMAYVAQRRVWELDALEQRIEDMERKLDRKGGME